MPRRMLALVSIGQFLGMTLWFSATAASPRIASEFALGPAGIAWLTIAVQGGFVIGTLLSALSNLADLVNARRLFAAGCVVGAVANASITAADSTAAIIVLRGITGAALACVYPPGMKIAAGWFAERRGTALGIVVGALTLGSAFPHLLAWTAADVDWRTLMVASSVLALVGGGIVVLLVRDGPYVAASAPFDPHAVLSVVRNRGARLATLGYLGPRRSRPRGCSPVGMGAEDRWSPSSPSAAAHSAASSPASGEIAWARPASPGWRSSPAPRAPASRVPCSAAPNGSSSCWR
jgi:MFS family permease